MLDLVIGIEGERARFFRPRKDTKWSPRGGGPSPIFRTTYIETISHFQNQFLCSIPVFNGDHAGTKSYLQAIRTLVHVASGGEDRHSELPRGGGHWFFAGVSSAKNGALWVRL